MGVVVVMDFGGGLAGMGAQDPTRVLDQASFERDRRGEEQGVQDGAVESLADELSRGDNQQRLSLRRCVEPSEGVAAGFGAHAAAQHDRVEGLLPELVGEPFDMRGPLGEHQAVPAAFQRGGHVIDNLAGAGVVGDEVAVDGRYPTGFPGVGFSEVAVGGVVHVQHRRWSLRGVVEFELRRIVVEGCGGLGDGVADRAELECDQVVELVAAVRVAVSPSQRRAGICLTACSNAAAGMWWHSSTTTSP